MVSSGGQRAVFGVLAVALLSACPFPRVQPIVEPATIPEVLLEVVNGSDAHLAGQPVVDFLDDVILSLGYQFFYVSCIHWHYLGIAVKSAISRK